MKIDELIKELKYTVLHLPWSQIRKDADEVVDRVAQALEAQQGRIAELEAELKEERYRHDRLQDFEVAEAQALAKLREERRWIPVGERLPEVIHCDAGTAYSEAVNVLTNGRKVLTAIWNGSCFLCDADYWEAWGEKITHWTPVLLPLPEPPKEDS